MSLWRQLATQLDANNLGIPITSASGTMTGLLNTTYWLAGIIAIIIIIIAGFMYVTSTGDAAKVAKAKNAILYAIIGLIIIIFAYVITGFITRSFS